jgi:putative transposase
MVLTKTKKRKNRKIHKKKNLNIINKDFITKNQCWIPKYKKKELFYNKSDSWFDIKSTHEKPEINGKIEIGFVKNLRCKKVNLFPTLKQREILLEWMEIYRIMYNKTISNKTNFINGYNIKSYFDIRRYMKENILSDDKKFLKTIEQWKIPAHTLYNAVNDVKKAFDSANGNRKAGNIKSFRLRHKKKSHHLKTLVLEPGAFSKVKNGFGIKILQEMISSEPLIDINHECRLSYNSRTGKFVLHVPYDKITKIYNRKNDVAIIDLGISTFANVYSPEGICYKFGTSETMNKIGKIINKINKVKKFLPNDNVKKSKTIQCYNKYLKRLRSKLTNMVSDLHWKTASFLCKRFNTILVGNLSTAGIVKKSGSVLNNFQKQKAIALSIYTFQQRIKSKAPEHKVLYKMVDESFSTQTCGFCGERDLNVGSSKVFKCPQKNCNFKMDRDYNGARNIYLKTMSLS